MRSTWSNCYELWQTYVYNFRQRLLNDIRQLQANVRYRDIDSIDCLEMMLAVERLNAFNEFVRDTQAIFNVMRKDERNDFHV